MGEIADKLADILVVTSDNPRQEDPNQIIQDIQIGISLDSEFFVESDRSMAIKLAIGKANKEDVVLIAGKGHEDYQILKRQTIHFDDCEQAKKALFLK